MTKSKALANFIKVFNKRYAEYKTEELNLYK